MSAETEKKVKFTWVVEKNILAEMKKKAIDLDKPLNVILTELSRDFLAKK